jgi:hypothetical protein
MASYIKPAESRSDDDLSEGRDVLYLMGGIALMIFGAGLVLTNPTVRKGVAAGLSAVLPDLKAKLPDMASVGNDIQRYMKLRSM